MHARQLANSHLVQQAISRVLLKDPSPQKLEPSYFGPYKVKKAHYLGTYALETPSGRMFKHFVHGNRLVQAAGCRDLNNSGTGTQKTDLVRLLKQCLMQRTPNLCLISRSSPPCQELNDRSSRDSPSRRTRAWPCSHKKAKVQLRGDQATIESDELTAQPTGQARKVRARWLSRKLQK